MSSDAMPKIEMQKRSSFPIYEDIPKEKIEAAQQYYKILKNKHPHFKTQRLMKKIAEHFHLKRIN